MLYVPPAGFGTDRGAGVLPGGWLVIEGTFRLPTVGERRRARR